MQSSNKSLVERFRHALLWRFTALFKPVSELALRAVRAAQWRSTVAINKLNLPEIICALGRLCSPRKRLGQSSLDFVVVSTGGCASSLLIEQLSGFGVVNDLSDRDGLKHLPRPPVGIKTLFIYAEPADVMSSLRRRGMLRAQASKIGCVGFFVHRGTTAEQSFIKAVNSQIGRFKRAEKRNPKEIFVVQYDELWDRLSEIAKFTEVNERTFVRLMPPRLPRSESSSTRNQS